jgi:hypothetical protein
MRKFNKIMKTFITAIDKLDHLGEQCDIEAGIIQEGIDRLHKQKSDKIGERNAARSTASRLKALISEGDDV